MLGQQDDEVAVRVSDTGPGLTDEEKQHIFKAFWQADGDGRRGAGLGLTVVKQIIDAHDGRIRVDSTPGEGTTFRFSVPVED